MLYKINYFLILFYFKMSKNLLEIKSRLKKEIIDYYDVIKGDIEYFSQIEIEKESFDRRKREIINCVEVIIERVKQIQTANLEEINKYFDQFESNRLRFDQFDEKQIKNIFGSFCFYIKSENAKLNFELNKFDQFGLGVLIVTGWFLAENEINFIRLVRF